MIDYYNFSDKKLNVCDQVESNCWIRLTSPTEEELQHVVDLCGVDRKYLEVALDKNVSPRVESTDEYLTMIVDVPVADERDNSARCLTFPVAFIITGQYIITICLKDTPVFSELITREDAEANPANQLDFVCHFLLIATELFQKFLHQIDDERHNMIQALGNKTHNSDLVRLHTLEATLVYFETALRGNKLVFNLIEHDEHLRNSFRDKSAFGELQLEASQAIEMASTYRELLRSTRDLFSATINNTLNSVLKVLTSITVIMAIPAIISGFYGMNIGIEGMPFNGSPYAFYAICFSTVVICVGAGVWLHKKGFM
jgi:magnesium transporter